MLRQWTHFNILFITEPSVFQPFKRETKRTEFSKHNSTMNERNWFGVLKAYVLNLYPLKTQNQRFSSVFRDYKMETCQTQAALDKTVDTDA